MQTPWPWSRRRNGVGGGVVYRKVHTYLIVLLSLHSAALLIYLSSRQPDRLLLQFGSDAASVVDVDDGDAETMHRPAAAASRTHWRGSPLPADAVAAASSGREGTTEAAVKAAGDVGGGGGNGGRQSARVAEVVAVAAAHKTDGALSRKQPLRGMVFRDGTDIGSMDGEIASTVVWSLVRSFSPEVNDHVREIFNDEYGECQFFANIPTIARRRGELLLVQRVWLAQYEYRKREIRSKQRDMNEIIFGWKNTWQENFLYHMRMNENYETIEPGELLGIPTTTNVMYSYKSDGAMDPRLVEVGDELFLMFHTWVADKDSNDEVGGRVHLWNWGKRQKKKLRVPGIRLQRTEINWIPMDVNGSLYVTYSLDPLRVMRCASSTGDCAFVHEQVANHSFSFSIDHLRGGTPFVAYRHPYYLGVGHSVGATYEPIRDFSVYGTHLIVLHAGDPWRIVYVSRHVEANELWLRSRPVIRNHTILGEFWYPMGIVMWDDDVIDVSCHLNDYDGHVVRLTGIRELMNKVIRADLANIASGETVRGLRRSRTVQQYVLESLKQRMPGYTFQADLVLNTPS